MNHIQKYLAWLRSATLQIRPWRTILLAAFLGIVPFTVQASGDTLEVGKPLARFSLLKPSSRVYLRYKIVGDERQTLDMWRRQASFENHEGRRFCISFGAGDSFGDSKFSRLEDSWFEPLTFRPLTVERRLTKDGNVAVRGFRYLPDRIVSMAEPAGNDQSDFVQLSKIAVHNWENDMELLQALPLAIGYTVKVPFYEAGPSQEAPDYYEYTVTSEDKIASADGNIMNCWVVTTQSSDPQVRPTRFWFEKRNQVLLREETKLKDAGIFVKMLVPYESAGDAETEVAKGSS